MTRKQSYWISFEGGEGAGKTSIIKRVANYFNRKEKRVVVTREPGGIPIAEQIRDIILHPEHTNIDARTEALLYAAARSQHFAEKIAPAIEEGAIILCDRFIDSSLAYQGIARGLGIEEVLAINRFAVGDSMPDLTLYYDVDPLIGLERISRDRKREMNRLDQETLSFHQQVREGYLQLLERFPQRIVQINAAASIEQVLDDTLQVIEQRMMK